MSTPPAGAHRTEKVDVTPPHTPDGEHRLAGTLVFAALALVVTQLVQLAASVIQGFAVPASGQRGLPGDLLHRIGFSFLTNITVANGLALVGGAVLFVLAGVVDPLALRRKGKPVAIAAIVLIVLAVVLAAGTILGVRTRLHQITLIGQTVLGYERLSLLTYLAGGVGSAVAAGLLAARFVRPQVRDVAAQRT